MFDLLDKDGIGNDVIGRSLRAKRVMDIIDCEDANGNTALSEAASRFFCTILLNILLLHGFYIPVSYIYFGRQ